MLQLLKSFWVHLHNFFLGGGFTQNWKCCGNCIFKSKTFMFNFPIKASFSLWWPEVLYQARITTCSLLLFVASSWYFFVGSQSFDWKCWKMMSISSRSYSCSCYKPSLFITYQRCSLSIKNNSESSENVSSTDTELPHFICFFSRNLVSLLQQILLY